MPKNQNQDIRDLLKRKRVSIYQLADVMQIAESTVYLRLRHPLTPGQKREIKAAVNLIASESKNADAK